MTEAGYSQLIVKGEQGIQGEKGERGERGIQGERGEGIETSFIHDWKITTKKANSIQYKNENVNIDEKIFKQTGKIILNIYDWALMKIHLFNYYLPTSISNLWGSNNLQLKIHFDQRDSMIYQEYLINNLKNSIKRIDNLQGANVISNSDYKYFLTTSKSHCVIGVEFEIYEAPIIANGGQKSDWESTLELHKFNTSHFTKIV